MKREDLIALGVAEDVVEKIMGLHGKDVEKHKTLAETAKTELDGVKAQLTEAGKQIEAFKGMNIDQIKASADEWKTKAEQAEKAAQDQIKQLKFDHALDGALAGAKAKNTKAVKALLDLEGLKLHDDGTIPGLEERLTKIKTDNDYLFEGDVKDPKIVTGGNNKALSGDAVVDAARAAAGLVTNK